MILSTEKEFIFIHIPKTAGQSITRALAPYADKPGNSPFRRLLSHLPVPEHPERAWLRAHDKASWLRLKLPRRIFDGYHKFAVVRNPYDYAVSYYHFLHGSRESRRHRDSLAWSFADFLGYLATKNRISGIAQSSWVTDRRGMLIVNELLRFETLEADFARLCARLGITAELPHLNRSDRGSYRDMYGPQEREIADRLFARDLALFGYEF
jgi:hypothetical protein